mmetsp:Transcript_8234/g.51274  ORF Transcript_8234/g.51274 Transcript_8234/m.51274 type:complete len:221 (+) Transcript_8234:2082-2744(+)
MAHCTAITLKGRLGCGWKVTSICGPTSISSSLRIGKGRNSSECQYFPLRHKHWRTNSGCIQTSSGCGQLELARAWQCCQGKKGWILPSRCTSDPALPTLQCFHRKKGLSLSSRSSRYQALGHTAQHPVNQERHTHVSSTSQPPFRMTSAKAFTYQTRAGGDRWCWAMDRRGGCGWHGISSTRSSCQPKVRWCPPAHWDLLLRTLACRTSIDHSGSEDSTR